MYIVLNSFRDKQDNNRLYKKGDTYPAAGVKVSKARLNFLCKENPDTGAVYLEEVIDPADTGNAAGEGEGLNGTDGEGLNGEGSRAGEE